MTSVYITKGAQRNSLATLLSIANKGVLLALLLFSVGCTEYWWTRGQPPSIKTLLERSRVKLADAQQSRGEHRGDILEISRNLESALNLALQASEKEGSGKEVGVQLQAAGAQMMLLEGKLSVGSRAAFGELSGQLRMFEQEVGQGEAPAASSLGLFTAHTLSFLANELTMPVPVVG